MRSALLVLLFLWTFPQKQPVHTTAIPDKMTFCGIELTLTESAKDKIRENMKKLYENPKYFNAAVERAQTYMPYIEEALQNVGAPDDLKYLALVESNLVSDIVSSSNAVGFWQFKAIPGMEYGLRIDSIIDERKHIYRSSEAAGLYFINANRDFDNWIYAVISYYEGITGAVKHTDPNYYGKKSMEIDDQLHFYALRALTYKLAYAEELSISAVPRIWTEPFSATGPVTVKELAAKHNLKEEDFLNYNKWLGAKSIPAGTIATYYIPHTNILYTGHKNDPNKVIGGGRPAPLPAPVAATVNPTPQPAPKDTIKPKPETLPTPVVTNPNPPIKPTGANSAKAVAFPYTTLSGEYAASYRIEDDLNYMSDSVANEFPEYLLYTGKKQVADIALYYKKKYADLLSWNHFTLGVEPPIGSLIYLVKPKKAKFHPTKKGETLQKIAAFHHTSVKKIQAANRMDKTDFTIYEGQKLYINETRPKGEKIIILLGPYISAGYIEKNPQPTEQPAPKPVEPTPPPKPKEEIKPIEPKVEPPLPTPNPNANPMPVAPPVHVFTSIWINYTVQAGESLWAIANKFGTKVEIIKRANELESEVLSPGKVLKIFAKPDKLTDSPTIEVLPTDEPILPRPLNYTVLKGETLTVISKKFNTTPDAIMKLNGLNSPNIREGQVLKVFSNK